MVFLGIFHSGALDAFGNFISHSKGGSYIVELSVPAQYTCRVYSVALETLEDEILMSFWESSFDTSLTSTSVPSLTFIPVNGPTP